MLAEREPDSDDRLESIIRLGGASAAAPAGDMTSLAAWLGPRMFMVAARRVVGCVDGLIG